MCVVLPYWSQLGPVFSHVADAWIQGSARITCKSSRSSGPSHELLDNTGIAEQESESPKLIVHERVHRIQHHRSHGGSRPEVRAVTLCLARELTEYGQEEALCLAGPCTSHDNQALAIDKRELRRGSLVLVRRIMNKHVQIALRLRDGLEDIERSGVEAEISKRRTRLIAGRALQVWTLVNHAGLFEKPPTLRDERRVADVIRSLYVILQRLM